MLEVTKTSPTPTPIPSQKKPTGRPTLDERIATAEKRLAEREKEREEVAATLRSLKARKINKDRKIKEAERKRRLILMGILLEETLLESDELFTDQFIKNVNADINTINKELNEREEFTEIAKKEKDKTYQMTKEEKELLKEYNRLSKQLADKKIIIENLNTLKERIANRTAEDSDQSNQQDIAGQTPSPEA